MKAKQVRTCKAPEIHDWFANVSVISPKLAGRHAHKWPRVPDFCAIRAFTNLRRRGILGHTIFHIFEGFLPYPSGSLGKLASNAQSSSARPCCLEEMLAQGQDNFGCCYAIAFGPIIFMALDLPLKSRRSLHLEFRTDSMRQHEIPKRSGPSCAL
jgi:hypothetical protein